jgi:hypothetical protein
MQKLRKALSWNLSGSFITTKTIFYQNFRVTKLFKYLRITKKRKKVYFDGFHIFFLHVNMWSDFSFTGLVLQIFLCAKNPFFKPVCLSFLTMLLNFSTKFQTRTFHFKSFCAKESLFTIFSDKPRHTKGLVPKRKPHQIDL